MRRNLGLEESGESGTSSRSVDGFTELLAAVQRLLERQLDAVLLEDEVTARQLRLLVCMEQHPSAGSHELAQRLLISRQALSNLTHRLLAVGLLRKSRTGSRRPLALVLTAAGREVVRRAGPRVARAEAAAVSGLRDGELDATREAPQRLLEDLSPPSRSAMARAVAVDEADDAHRATPTPFEGVSAGRRPAPDDRTATEDLCDWGTR